MKKSSSAVVETTKKLVEKATSVATSRSSPMKTKNTVVSIGKKSACVKPLKSATKKVEGRGVVKTGDLVVDDIVVVVDKSSSSSMLKTTKPVTDEENSQSLADTPSSVSPVFSTMTSSSNSSDTDTTSSSYLLIDLKLISVDFGLFAGECTCLQQSDSQQQSFLCINANATAAHLISLINKKMQLTNKEFEV